MLHVSATAGETATVAELEVRVVYIRNLVQILAPARDRSLTPAATLKRHPVDDPVPQYKRPWFSYLLEFREEERTGIRLWAYAGDNQDFWPVDPRWTHYERDRVDLVVNVEHHIDRRTTEPRVFRMEIKHYNGAEIRSVVI